MHAGLALTAEGVGMTGWLVTAEDGDGDEAVVIVDLDEDGGAWVGWLDEAMCYCAEGRWVYRGQRGKVERSKRGVELSACDCLRVDKL